MAAEYEQFLRKIQEGLADRAEGTEGIGGPPPPSPSPKQQPEQQQQQHDDDQQQQQQQPLLLESPSFKQLYDNICQEIRSSGTLDTVMNDFQVVIFSAQLQLNMFIVIITITSIFIIHMDA